jgi:NitT/TauT family transport system permease protein
MAFVGAVIGEYLGSARGIGYVILLAESVFDINAVFAGLIVLTVVALALDAVVTVLENRVLAWRPAAG